MKQHRTSDGRTMLVCQMSNEHLLALVRYHVAPVLEKKEAIEESALDVTSFQKEMYRGTLPTVESLAQWAWRKWETLEPYLAEIAIRMTPEIVTDPNHPLMKALLLVGSMIERNGQVPGGYPASSIELRLGEGHGDGSMPYVAAEDDE